MSSNQGDKLTKSKVLVFFNTYKLHNCMKVEHSRHSVYYSETISYNYEMKWIRYNKKTTSYNYEMKFIRFYIFMKEFIALLKNEILPSLLKKCCFSFLLSTFWEPATLDPQVCPQVSHLCQGSPGPRTMLDPKELDI